MQKLTSLIITIVVFFFTTIVPLHAAQADFIEKGAVWKYLDNGTDQGTAWQANNFDDTSWASGPAKLGYSNGVTTVVSFGPDSSNKYRTTYFRRQFTVQDVNDYTALQLDILRDDGAVVYLNGTEVARTNMPAGEINYLTKASSPADENTYFHYDISTAALINGTNTLAVELHQTSSGSSDLSVDLSFVGIPFAPVFDQDENLFVIDHAPANGELLATVSATDHQGDALQYNLLGAEASSFAIDNDGKITANGTVKLGSYTFDVNVSDGTHSVTKTITLLFSVDIAHRFGIASQGTDSSYQYYSPAANAIDNDDSTFNHTRGGNKGENWLQVQLPTSTQISQIIIQSRNHLAYRLVGAKVYISNTPYSGTLNESDLVYTLAGTGSEQIIDLTTAKSGSYLIIKGEETAADNRHLHLLKAQVYGVAPAAPAFNEGERNFLVPQNISSGALVAVISGVDYQYDAISYSIDSDVPFTIDNQGNITVSGVLTPETTYTFDVLITAGGNTSRTTVTIQATSATAVEDVLETGDILNTPVTVDELLQAARDEIANLSAENPLLSEIYQNGAINYDAGNYHSTLITIKGDITETYPVLYGNKGNILAVAGQKEQSRFSVFASNPLYFFNRSEQLAYEPYMKRIIAWLIAGRPINMSVAEETKTIALTFASNSSAIENWLGTNYPAWTVITCNDKLTLDNCLTNADLIILGKEGDSADADALKVTLPLLIAAAKPILYLHPNWSSKDLTQAVGGFFNLSFNYSGNYFAADAASWTDVEQMQTAYVNNSLEYGKIDTMLKHFQDNDYSFDWGMCKNSSGQMGESNDRCDDVTGLSSEFQDGASLAKSMVDTLESNQIAIFNETGYKLQKLLILIADKFRQTVSYPMDKVTTDDNVFMRSYYADHVVYNYRKIAPTQTDMGNFSRSDFSHITPITKTVNVTSKKNFRSTGVYALPGQTVKVTRNDSSDLTVKVFINTLRSGATHQYQKKGYKRPKYLKTPSFEIKQGETIELTSPYGGTLQLSFNKNDLPVEVTFENVGEHAYWASTDDNDSFAQKLAANEYDWAEVATAGFEVHSTLEKMKVSVADPNWGGTAEGLAAAVVKYTSNYPHVLAGFKGNGVDVVPEIHDWADSKGITIETIDIMKHMNADQALCGYGCSGNPYDAYWSFNPIGHGDIHELGHSLQKKRFEGFPNHAATNTFSYYTKSRYFDNTGVESTCQGIPFKTLFDTIQSAVGQTDVEAYLKTNLWDTAGLGEQYLLKIQAMMHAQNMGKVENGWHVLARVHILEREMSRAKQDWDNRKASVGYSTYTLEEINSIRDNDWLIIAYSYAAGVDYRNYFDMMGIPYSQKARDQIATFGFDVASNELFVSTNEGYCAEDGAGRLFDRPTLAIDGSSTWPAETDTDEDGRWDAYDNCPADANADQSDSDANGIGDACQDTDNDTVIDINDNCPVNANTDQLNTDSDTQGNVCDSDDDNDNVVDAQDAFPLNASESVDTDNDGTGNNADLDDDNDNIPDDWELANGLNPLDASDATADNDRDGVSNLDEYLAGSNPNDSVFTWDIDDDGTVKPLTDGLLNLRYHFGFRGDTLINNAVDNGAARTTATDIEAYISSSLSEGDIDGDGTTKPLTDGLLLLRYLFGFRGDTLMQNAIDTGATRQLTTDIEPYITERMPE